MARRIDYLDDPDAPTPNSLVPSVNALVVNDAGQILMIQRTDNDSWSLPGGKIDLGETVREAAIRETHEETGVGVRITGVNGIYTNPRHLIEYTSDGEVRQEFTIVLTARPLSGEPTPSDESSHVEWVFPANLGKLTMHPEMRKRLDHHLDGSGEPYLD
ncbi:MAG TPA: NUDIX domain-containing protein [Nocardioidaceae bacterium]|nr:NUDIX domain-containing protein [Nocardioidaceae bacterium]